MSGQRSRSPDEATQASRSSTSPLGRAERVTRRPRRPRALQVHEFAPGERTDLFVRIWEDPTGQPVLLPVIVARGGVDGPVVGISATVHGNELNGIRIIHSLLQDLRLTTLRGTLLCAPIVNVPAFALRQRVFMDGRDLNHHFPGREHGRPVEQYARAFQRTFLPPCEHLVDIHTASEGRVNTMYVRADLEQPATRRLAELMNPEIILHVRGGDGTLRHAARARGIHAITVEAGNPSVFQGRMVFEGEVGILNILTELGMRDGEVAMDRTPVVCRSSQWLRTTAGGLLETHFKLGERVARKQVLARTVDPFGYPLDTYRAPRDGVVIGMARNPLAVPGTRYCHLGVPAAADEEERPDADDPATGGATPQ